MQFHPKDLSELDELTEEHLGFSALSEGLGFARQSKRAPQKPLESFDSPTPTPNDAELQRKAFSGIGAVAAGPARPIPSVTAGGPTLARPGLTKSATSVAPTTRAVPATASSVLSEPAAPRELRLAAFVIDVLILFVPMAFGWWISFHSRALAIFNQDRKPPLMLFGLIVAVYFLLSESFGGQSLGKMLLGLRVVEDDKYQKSAGLAHASKRLFLFVVGASLGGIGLLASFWDSKRRPWHDRYSGTIVRQK